MRINVEGDTEIGAYFVSFVHVRDGKNYHADIRMDDIKSLKARSGTRTGPLAGA